MGHLGARGDVARTDDLAEADRQAILRIARGDPGEGYDALADARKRGFGTVMRPGLHCAGNPVGPALGSADMDTHPCDPLTGPPR